MSESEKQRLLQNYQSMEFHELYNLYDELSKKKTFGWVI